MSNLDLLNPHRFFGDEAEILGHRLDLARTCLNKSKTEWSQNYWNNVIECLVTQWKSSPAVNHGQSLGPDQRRWTVSLDFYEPHCSRDQMDFSHRVFNRIFRTKLDQSWERERNRKLIGGY